MNKKKLDLGAKTLGEKWFQYVINKAANVWFIWLALAIGISNLILHAKNSFERSSPLLWMGVLWLTATAIFFERYQARKVIERLMEEKEALSIAKEVEAGPPE